MSEKVRKIRTAAGICLIPAALILLLAGLLPVKKPSGTAFTGSVGETVKPAALRHLSDGDPFNSGDVYDLEEFPGIGETLASFILDERKENGSFYFPEDIMQVKGIGEKKLEQIRPGLHTEDAEGEE